MKQHDLTANSLSLLGHEENKAKYLDPFLHPISWHLRLHTRRQEDKEVSHVP